MPFPRIVPLYLCVVLVGLAGAGQFARGQSKLNVSRLKAGDKLEVQRGFDWEPAEFVELINEYMIRVKVESVPFPIPTSVKYVRRATHKAKPAAAAAEENPFATDEERIAARKPRTWSDPEGKFKVEATLLRVEDAKAVLKRTDNKEVSVPLARLSDADREYVESLEPEAAEELPAEPAKKDPFKKEPPAPPEMPITKTNLASADVLELSGDQWTYQPDPAPERTPLRNVRLPVNKWETFEQLQRILLLPEENRGYLVTKYSFQDQKFNVQALDLQRGSVSGSGLFSTQAAPIAVSPDGKLILARSESFGFGKTAELRLYKREGMKALPDKAWVPYSHHGPLEQGVHGPNYPRDAEVLWADFLGSDRVVSLSRIGELAVWQTSDLKPLYQVKLAEGAQAAISRGGKYLAISDANSVVILHAADGKVAGSLPTEGATTSGQLDFSLDGRKLALLTQGTRLRVWDLTTQELEREFAVPPTGRFGDDLKRDLAWVTSDYLLVGHRVISVPHYRTVWTYTGLTRTPWLEFCGRVWFVADDRRAPTLTSGAAPPKSVIEKWSKAPADGDLVIHPGTEVAVALNTNDAHTATVREKIVDSLTRRGLKVVPDSPIKLVGSIVPGNSQTLNYETWGFRAPRTTTSVTVQGNVATLQFQVGGKTVWQSIRETSAPHMFHTKQGESLAQTAQKQADLDSRAFDVWIPVYVPQPDPDAESEKSPYPG